MVKTLQNLYKLEHKVIHFDCELRSLCEQQNLLSRAMKPFHIRSLIRDRNPRKFDLSSWQKLF